MQVEISYLYDNEDDARSYEFTIRGEVRIGSPKTFHRPADPTEVEFEAVECDSLEVWHIIPSPVPLCRDHMHERIKFELDREQSAQACKWFNMLCERDDSLRDKVERLLLSEADKHEYAA